TGAGLGLRLITVLLLGAGITPHAVSAEADARYDGYVEARYAGQLDRALAGEIEVRVYARALDASAPPPVDLVLWAEGERHDQVMRIARIERPSGTTFVFWNPQGTVVGDVTLRAAFCGDGIRFERHVPFTVRPMGAVAETGPMGVVVMIGAESTPGHQPACEG
ncbi:MAG TPA: hypothetical protein VM600_01755, partial [Actinomycetota bacterium]|nr:hypothetical protein [Actinomycetota bacterium]